MHMQNYIFHIFNITHCAIKSTRFGQKYRNTIQYNPDRKPNVQCYESTFGYRFLEFEFLKYYFIHFLISQTFLSSYPFYYKRCYKKIFINSFSFENTT